MTNRIFTYCLSKKTKGVWFTELEMDLQDWGSRARISRNVTVGGLGGPKKTFGAHQVSQEKPKLRTGKTWTAERKEANRKRIREFRAKAKIQGRKQLN